MCEITNNTAPHLAADIEKLREHLGIEKWHMVFGGSWGSTLSLLYAQTYPTKLKCLVLRGICVWSKAELAHTHGTPHGAAYYFPAEYERFLEYLPEDERRDPIPAYYTRIMSEDRDLAYQASKEWNRWELSIGSLKFDPKSYDQLESRDWSLFHATMETHYAMTGGGLEDEQLLAPENMEKIKHIPGKFDPSLPEELDLLSRAFLIVSHRCHRSRTT
jgi:proline iminopeptidase